MKTNAALLLATLLCWGCGKNTARQAEGAFLAVKGHGNVGGGVRLEEAPRGVKVLVWLENAPPGPKDVRVHERGDCSDPLVESMGKHFAPRGEPHASGDLGNLEIRDDGNGYLEVTTERGNLDPNDPTSFANRAIVVHQREDKGPAPSGESEKPLACAVIKAS
jgi:Cu/Zn superoxide dismutase